MATIVLYIAASLDGYVAAPDGGVAWLDEFDDHYADGAAEQSSYESFFESVDALVMGSRTYEQVLTEFLDGESDEERAENWPYGDRLTYVLTSRDLPQANERVEISDASPEALVERLGADYETIWLVGGPTLAQAFLRQGLLDEIRLSVIPLLLGDGISLFGDDGPQRPLHLRDVTAFESGIVELEYEVTRE